jgi:hypothetical protein
MSAHSTGGFRFTARLPINVEMTRLPALIGAVLCLVPAASATASSTEDDRAQRALEKVDVRMARGFTAVVNERFESTLFYKVCVHRKAKPRQRACRQGETNTRGVGRVSFQGFVSRHGAGRYVATWTGGGLELGTARFRAG